MLSAAGAIEKTDELGSHPAAGSRTEDDGSVREGYGLVNANILVEIQS
jgi:hypothetical protein